MKVTHMVNDGGGSTVHNKHHSPFMRQIRRGRISAVPENKEIKQRSNEGDCCRDKAPKWGI
jgi:hypothetical protein